MLQDIQEAHAGQIVAVFGVDCASGLTPSVTCICRAYRSFIFMLFFMVV